MQDLWESIFQPYRDRLLRSSQPKQRILMGLRMVAEGLGLRSTSRVLQIKLDTIRKWLAVAALHCEQVSDLLIRDLKLSQVQVDELWTFIKKNTKISLDRQPQRPVSSSCRSRP